MPLDRLLHHGCRAGVYLGGLLCAAVACAQPDAASVRLLTGVTLIDGTGAPARPGMTVELSEGRIRDVYATGSRAVPLGAAVVDLQGHWLIPGLIDAHVHVATDPSGTDNRGAMIAKLQGAVRGGVTTVRDMAGDGRALAELARATRTGDVAGPEIHYSAVWAGERFMADPRVASSTRGTTAGAEPWMRTIGEGIDWSTVAAEARGAGASGIKLYADASPALVQQAAAAAHRARLRVWAHATVFPARPSDLVAAGVDVLSHAPLLAWQTVESLPDFRSRRAAPYRDVSPDSPAMTSLLQEMKARGALLEPTLFVFSRQPRDAELLSWSSRATARAHALGVGIVAGTDGLIGDNPNDAPNIHRELELLVAAGLSPLEALRAATGNAARALGIEDRTGTIRPGLAADLVVLNADPLADIRNTRRIARVIQRGVDVAR